MILVLSLILTSNPINSSDGLSPHSNVMLTKSKLDQVNSSLIPDQLELTLDKKNVEFGDKLGIFYGVLDNETNYIGNVSYYLYLYRNNTQSINQEVINNSDILANKTSQPNQMEFNLDTLPSNIDTLVPNNYTIIFRVPRINQTDLVELATFTVYPHEGANIEIVFTDLLTTSKIEDALKVKVNQSRTIRVELFNLGSGNALDVSVENTQINQPLEFNSPPETYNLISLPPFDQHSEEHSFNFTINVPNFGLASLQFVLTYNNTLNAQIQKTKQIRIHALPSMNGVISSEDRKLTTGKAKTIFLTVINNEQTPIRGSFRLSSSKVSFNPTVTQFEDFTSGVSRLEFSAISFENGSATIDVIFIFQDEDGETLDIHIRGYNFEILQTNQQIFIEEPNPFLVTAIILYGFLLLLILLFVLRKDFRSAVINRFITDEHAPDIEFESNTVIVDGSNIAWEDLDENNRPKIENILLAIKKLEQYEFEEIIVVADAALRYQIEKVEDLDKQVKKGIIKVLPAKVDGDSFILRLSKDLNALILTNDLFKEYRDEFNFIDKRRVPYSILNGNIYLHPPYEDKS